MTVKVKPLVWVVDEDDPDCIRSGEYWIYHEGLGYQVYLGAVVFGDTHKTLAAAKDAVWQHHVAYVLAAIEAPMQEPFCWLPTVTAKWLEEYDGPACATTTAAHNRPIKSGGIPLYTTPQLDETAALRAKLAEVEATLERTKAAHLDDVNNIADEMKILRADRDEERKLADDAVHELKHARAVLRHEQYLDDPGREAVIARHAARRKEETLVKHGSKT